MPGEFEKHDCRFAHLTAQTTIGGNRIAWRPILIYLPVVPSAALWTIEVAASLDHPLIRGGAGRDRLFDEAVEEQAGGLGAAAVEAEGELVQVLLEVLAYFRQTGLS
jgi:hypothetical protein